MSDDDNRQTHPSYGLASFSRRTGNPGRLFGSPLHTHEAYVTLAIKEGFLMKESTTGHERFYGSVRGDIIEVDLSAAQFAELLTTMNVGLGVPCTIRWLNGERVPNPPDIPQEVEKVRTHFKTRMKDATEELKKNQTRVVELLEKKSLSQADRREILESITNVRRHLEANVPFYLEMFEEAANRVVVHAKAEIDAFVTHNVIAEGVKVIRERMTEPEVAQLKGGET